MEMANLWLRMCIVVSFCSQTAPVLQNFNDEPSDILAIAGTNISLPCVIQEPGHVRWMRNGVCMRSAVPNFEENTHYEINSNTSYDFSLTIFNVTHRDIGIYQCITFGSGKKTVGSRPAVLLVFDINVLRPPPLGDDFLRYISMSDMQFRCTSVFTDKDFEEVAKYGNNPKTWLSATNNGYLNELLNDLSGMTFNCTIQDEILRNLPTISLILKVSYSNKLVLASAIGSRISEELVCIADDTRSKLAFSCFNLLTIDDEDKTAQLKIECDSKLPKVLTCTVKGAKHSYTFFLCAVPDNRCHFDSPIIVPTQDLYVFTNTSSSNPESIVWEKSTPSALATTETAVITTTRECCSTDKAQIVLQMEIDHENHNIPLEIVISVKNLKNMDQSARSNGIFQVTCFYWIWKDKVFTIFHEGIVIPNLCKVVTLQIKVTVSDKSVLETKPCHCILLNKPKGGHMLQQFSKIPNIYPIAGVICLSCVTMLTMIYIGRRLLELYDRTSKPRVCRQIELLTQGVRTEIARKMCTLAS
uniref:Ig-like domain-containing protein n=1 Tax=Strigamia maritima TaxID=126957 RepID=T1J904_STRMM